MTRASGARRTPPSMIGWPSAARFIGLSGCQRNRSESSGSRPAKAQRCQPAAGQRAAMVRAAGPSAMSRASRNTLPWGETASRPWPTALVVRISASAPRSGQAARATAPHPARSSTASTSSAKTTGRCARCAAAATGASASSQARSPRPSPSQFQTSSAVASTATGVSTSGMMSATDQGSVVSRATPAQSSRCRSGVTPDAARSSRHSRCERISACAATVPHSVTCWWNSHAKGP